MTVVKRTELAHPDGVRWTPNDPLGVGVLVLAGSSGRVDTDRARLFAEIGCLAESIRWFGGPRQHDGPWEIPLETFLDRVAGLAGDCDRVYVVGTSFGSEAPLLCGALSDLVDGVVALAPSDVVWAGHAGDGRETSHWTYHRAPLLWVSFDWSSYQPENPPRYLPMYRRSRTSAGPALAAATIPVHLIDQLLVVAGGDDQVWPSMDHAARIEKLRADAGLPTISITDPDAGHRILLPGEPAPSAGVTMQRGGSDEADRRLGSRAWRAIVDMLTPDASQWPDAAERT